MPRPELPPNQFQDDRGDRSPCLDDLIEHLQTMRGIHGNIVVVRSDDDVQAPGDYYAIDQFFVNWPDV